MKKKLVIIHGVTGAIGSACLSLFASQPNTVVYGISRKAKHFKELCQDLVLPAKTLICSIYDSDEHYGGINEVSRFFHTIPKDVYSDIHYIHAIGHYPFEIDDQGNHFISHDNDMDGIDDRCTILTYETFLSFFLNQRSLSKVPRFFIFGGLADRHEPVVHASYWKTMKRLKEN